jgi:hypothetical protein
MTPLHATDASGVPNGLKIQASITDERTHRVIMSNHTSTAEYSHFPRSLLWRTCHVLAVICLYTLFFKEDTRPFNTYTVLFIFTTIFFTVTSLVRLIHVFRQRRAAPRE